MAALEEMSGDHQIVMNVQIYFFVWSFLTVHPSFNLTVITNNILHL